MINLRFLNEYFIDIYTKNRRFSPVYIRIKNVAQTVFIDQLWWKYLWILLIDVQKEIREEISLEQLIIFFSNFSKKKKNKINFRLLSKLSLIFALGSWFFQRMCSQLAQITPESFISLKQLWDFWRI